MSQHPDAVIVGGGVIGMATAWRAAQRGLVVDVVDPAPGRGASWAAAGLLAPVTEVHYGEESLLRLNRESAGRYPAFVAELEDATGMGCGYRMCGTLLVARDRDDMEALDDLFGYQQRLGLGATRLGAREVRLQEPALAPSTRGGILVEGDHQIDNRALLEALAVACDHAQVGLHESDAVHIVVEDERVTGVQLDDGSVIDTEKVVIAAGAWSGQIDGIPPEARPAVRPVKGQLLHLRDRTGAPFLAHNLRGIDVYMLAREDGRVVVGASVEEQGFDMAATAGTIHRLLEDAADLVPGVTELMVEEIAVGLRPGTPDNAPLLGSLGLEGLYAATGHYRNGILLAPVTADEIARLVAESTISELIAPFDPLRFTTAGVVS